MIQFRFSKRPLLRRNNPYIRSFLNISGSVFIIAIIFSISFGGKKTDAQTNLLTSAEKQALLEIERLNKDPSIDPVETVLSENLKVQNSNNSKKELIQQISSIQKTITQMLENNKTSDISEKTVSIKKGDTLAKLLVKKASLSHEKAYEIIKILRENYDPRDLNPGHKITVLFKENPKTKIKDFTGLRIEKDILHSVVLKQDKDGNFTSEKIKKTTQASLKTFKGTINSSLYMDAKKDGMSDPAIIDLIKMYSWNVDFQREIQSGDKYEVMYEEHRTQEGKVVSGKGKIIYAKLSLSGNEMPFYRFKDKTGFVDYYDAKGRSAKKQLMKTPIDGARLSSGFGRRKHPVLGYTKMHTGLDFAAARGTPIYAAGDGIITYVGRRGSFGKYVQIRHRHDLKTAYAHMKKFKSGLHKGMRVKQGSVIGYVGTTGRSTGPHLHYEVIVNNQKRNPSTLKLPTGNILKGKNLRDFKHILARTQRNLQNAGIQIATVKTQLPVRRPIHIAHKQSPQRIAQK